MAKMTTNTQKAKSPNKRVSTSLEDNNRGRFEFQQQLVHFPGMDVSIKKEIFDGSEDPTCRGFMGKKKVKILITCRERSAFHFRLLMLKCCTLNSRLHNCYTR